MSLRKQAQRDLESILDSFNNTGTKLLFEEWKNFHDHLVNTAADQCDTADKWFQRRGEIAALRYIMGAHQQAEEALKNLPEAQFADEEPRQETERNPLEE